MSAVATMSVEDQVAAAVALALQGNDKNKAIADAVAIALKAEKDKRKAKRESKPSSLATDLQTVHKLEQSQASERDMLVEEGHKLCGTGLTLNRVVWAEKLISYARLHSDKNAGCMKVIAEIQSSILHKGNDVSCDTTGKNGKIRTINESLQLACVAHFIPQVKLLDWGVALLFVRFLEKFSVVSPEISHADDAKKIAIDVGMKKPEYLNKNGYIDRKNVKLMIDSIIGTSRASKASPMEAMKAKIEQLEAHNAELEAQLLAYEKTGSTGVTSIHAVADWLIQSQTNDIVELMGMLPAQRATVITETMLHNLGSTLPVAK